MKILIALALVVCVVALILTIILARSGDSGYSSEKSFSNLSGIYLLLPVVVIVIVVVVLLFI